MAFVLRGSYSDWSTVTSGVPQGTILGTALFLIYINDISDVVTSDIKLFADDTKIYRKLQPNDVYTVAWQVKFNPKKCEVMRITHKQNKSKHSYHLSNTVMKLILGYSPI